VVEQTDALTRARDCNLQQVSMHATPIGYSIGAVSLILKQAYNTDARNN